MMTILPSICWRPTRGFASANVRNMSRRGGEWERGRVATPSGYRILPLSLSPTLPLFAAAVLTFVFTSGALPQAAAQDDEQQAAADLDLVSAVERVVSRAIARAERSVVSIARRKKTSPEVSRVDSHPNLFLRNLEQGPRTPFDPNFAPNELASGVIVDARGLVLTNRHVLGDNPTENDFYVTTIDRKVFAMKAKIKASDGPSDLAVLEPIHESMARAGDFTPIQFGDAATLKKGQIVIALGNPYGIARDGQASASWGIVSNLSRKSVSASEDDSQKTLHDYGTLIQTDAKLNLGTSGGALVNLRGEMVGLTTSLAAAAGFEQPAGYAIPVDKAFLRIIQALKEGREVEYGLLGIRPNNRPSEDMNRGLVGIIVSEVVEGGPASKAKVEVNDIITHVDDQPIYDTDGLRLHVSKLAPATTTVLTVLRSGQTKRHRVVLSKLAVTLPQTYTERPPAWRGAVIDYRKPRVEIDPLQFVHRRDSFKTPCVEVREIDEKSPAWKAGLRQGMLISHVGKTPVETPAEFQKAVSAQSRSVELRLVTPDGSKQTLVVPVE